MIKINLLNWMLGVFYGGLSFSLYNTGFVYSGALTFNNNLILFLIPFCSILFIMNISFIFLYKTEKNIFKIIYKILSLTTLFYLMFSAISFPWFYIMMSTNIKILFASIALVLLTTQWVISFIIFKIIDW